MSYTVMIDGVPVLCESASDAIALARAAASSGATVQSPGGLSTRKPEVQHFGGSRWTEERTVQFFKSIGENQKRLVEALLETNDGRTDEQLFQILGLNDGRAMAGVFTGLWKNAKKIGADPEDLYQRTPATIGNRRLYEYRLSDSFRAAAKKWKP